MIERKLMLETKAQVGLAYRNYRQLQNYLASSTGCRLGLLVNFGEASLKFKRIIL